MSKGRERPESEDPWLPRVQDVPANLYQTGPAVDTAELIMVAFGGLQPPTMILRIILSAYLIKVSVEVVATPITYLIVGWLKSSEAVNAFDRRTNFNPFAWLAQTV